MVGPRAGPSIFTPAHSAQLPYLLNDNYICTTSDQWHDG